MARPESKKNLQGDIPKILHDELTEWIEEHKNLKITQCLQAMTELWLMLPERLQALLLISKRDSEAFNGVASELEENILPDIELYVRREKEASKVIRRIFLLAKDYAITREGIENSTDLKVALDAITEIFYWADPKIAEKLENEADYQFFKSIVRYIHLKEAGLFDFYIKESVEIIEYLLNNNQTTQDQMNLLNNLKKLINSHNIISAEPESEEISPVISGRQIVSDVTQKDQKKYHKDPKTG